MLPILIFTVIFLYFFNHLYWKRRNLPPGPCPLPLLGNLVDMTKPKPGYECFRRWTEKFGDVYTFWLGSQPYVIIGSYQKIKETFIMDGETYMDKMPQKFQQTFRGGNYGVVETNGQVWKEHRRFALHQLRDLGIGKDVMQQKILIEVEEMFKRYDEKLGVEQNIPKIMDDGVGNMMNQIVFGYRFEGEKLKEFRKLRDLMEFQEAEFGKFKTQIQVFIPIMEKILPGKNITQQLEHFRDAFYSFFNSQVEEHRASINFDSEDSEDYAEAYLKEQRKRESEGDFESFSNKQLANMCVDLWFAGLSSTTTILSWGIAFGLNYPEIQKKLQKELDQVVGGDRLVTTADKNDLPYMQAFVNETLRCVNIIPLNVFHCTTKDTVISGFPIPKGTGVIAQLSTVLLDEKVFPDPYTFNPDRFIENGKLRKVEELVPFSIGKRQCLGEGLARMELFLFIANFFNRYELTPSSEGVPSIDKSLAAKVTPRRFSGVLTKRH